jgi:hypothetical protein
MKNFIGSLARRLFREQHGQALLWAAGGITAILGIGGLLIDVGRAYVVRGELQNYANAAALAAAGNVYNSSSTANASYYAGLYSAGATTDENYNSGLGVVTPTVTTKCLNLLMPTGITCSASGNVANAVQVTETATIKTFLMRVLGFKTITVSATALASMQGKAQPWNVAIIVDSTGSMNTGDNNCGSGVTEFQCALSGVQNLLGATNPACPSGTTCPNGYNFRVALFTFPNVLTQVSTNGGSSWSLPSYTFNGTNVTFDSINDEINCSGTPGSYSNYKLQPLAAPYTLPQPGATLPEYASGTGTNGELGGLTYLTYSNTSGATTTLWQATYQITPFLSNYYNATSSSTGYLNTSSALVQAVGYGATKGCLTYTFGIDGSTGGGSGFGNTYFASSIYAAQSALAQEQAAVPGSKNALIFLSDGQANASEYSKNSGAYSGANGTTNQYLDAYQFPEGPAGSEVGPSTLNNSPKTYTYPVPPYYTPATILASQNTLGYDTLSSSAAGGTRSGSTQGTYPDWYDQCQQAIAAAHYAQTQGTVVYAVAYGAESAGCSDGWNIGESDTALVISSATQTSWGLIQPFSPISKLLPCTTMEDMASSWNYFYSDNEQQGNVNLGCTDNNHTTVSLQDIFLAIAASFTNPRLLPNNAT